MIQHYKEHRECFVEIDGYQTLWIRKNFSIKLRLFR